MKSRLFNIIVVTFAAACFAQAQVTNGGFENPAAPVGDILLVNNNDVTGWHMNGEGALISNTLNAGYGTTWHHSDDGAQYLYINSNTAGNVTVSQSLGLTAGAHDVSFEQADFASGFNIPGGDLVATIVRDSDSLVIGSEEFTTAAFADFATKDLNFTAPTAENYTLSFTSVYGHAGIIDKVQLDAVPEPASLTLLGLGIAGLVKRRARRSLS